MGQVCCCGGKANSDGKMSIGIFLSSVRPYRMADRVGKYVKDRVEASGMSTYMIDPSEIQIDLEDKEFKLQSDKDSLRPLKPLTWHRELHDKIRAADGYLIISAEYNSSIPPALLSMLNNFPHAAFSNKPVGIITYSEGYNGGIRAQTLLTEFVNQMSLVPLPTRIAISNIAENISEDGKCTDKRIVSNVSSIVQELDWYADALRVQQRNKPFES